MKIRVSGRVIKEGSDWTMEADLAKDEFAISQRSISVVVKVNGVYQATLKEFLIVEII